MGAIAWRTVDDYGGAGVVAERDVDRAVVLRHQLWSADVHSPTRRRAAR